MKGLQSWKHIIQSESSESIKTRLAASFIGLGFMSPGEGQAVHLSFRERGELTNQGLIPGRQDKQKKTIFGQVFMKS